jgi:hypothetical protein
MCSPKRELIISYTTNYHQDEQIAKLPPPITEDCGKEIPLLDIDPPLVEKYVDNLQRVRSLKGLISRVNTGYGI